MDTDVHTFCQRQLSPFIYSYCSLMASVPLPKRCIDASPYRKLMNYANTYISLCHVPAKPRFD